MSPQSLTVFVETHKKTSSPFFEDVLVEQIGDNRYKLLRSPGFLTGFAAGDEFSWDGATKHASLLQRGGNVCIQYFRKRSIAEVEQYLSSRLPPLNGRVDGMYKDRLLILTIPATAGFDKIESIVRDAEARFPDSEWLYANVYDPVDGSPLGWWKKIRP